MPGSTDLRHPPGPGRIGGLDHGTQERPVRSVLFAGRLGVFAVSPPYERETVGRSGLAGLSTGDRAVSRGPAQQDGDVFVARGIAAVGLVEDRSGWKRDVLPLAPLFVLGAALGLVTIRMEKHAGADRSGVDVVVCPTLPGGRSGMWFYAGKLFWPQQLTFIYPRWEIDAGAAWQYLFPVAVLAVLIALWSLRSRIGRGPLAAVLFFAGTLAPALGFFDLYPFRYSYVADHFQYLACIGLIALTASAGTVLYQRAGQQGRDLGRLATVLVLLLLGVSTWKQAHVYQDPEILWRDTLAKNPAAWMAHNNLSAILVQQGKIEEAIWHSARALVSTPGTGPRTTIWETLCPISAASAKPSGSTSKRCVSCRAARKRTITWASSWNGPAARGCHRAL